MRRVESMLKDTSQVTAIIQIFETTVNQLLALPKLPSARQRDELLQFWSKHKKLIANAGEALTKSEKELRNETVRLSVDARLAKMHIERKGKSDELEDNDGDDDEDTAALTSMHSMKEFFYTYVSRFLAAWDKLAISSLLGTTAPYVKRARVAYNEGRHLSQLEDLRAELTDVVSELNGLPHFGPSCQPALATFQKHREVWLQCSSIYVSRP